MIVDVLTGDVLDDALDDIARLRLGAFRDWPYLHEASWEYEKHYFEAVSYTHLTLPTILLV